MAKRNTKEANDQAEAVDPSAANEAAVEEVEAAVEEAEEIDDIPFDFDALEILPFEEQIKRLQAMKQSLKAREKKVKQESKAKVEKVLTEEEEERLAEIDARIEELNAELDELKAERNEIKPVKRSGAGGSGRGPAGVGAFVKDMILEGADNETIMEAVKIQFPLNHTNLNCVNWYRGALKKWPENFGRPPSPQRKAYVEVDDEEQDEAPMTTEYSE